MKLLGKKFASFFLGFAFFIGGGAVATEVVDIPMPGIQQESEENSTEAPSPGQDATNELSEEEARAIQELIDNPVFCSDVGKPNELGNDCFCVEGDVSTMEEVDCLIASGIVDAAARADYEAYLSGVSAAPLRDNANPVFCWAIGKANELDGDCFCVEGEVSTMEEVDCLIASGIVDPSDRWNYEYELLGTLPEEFVGQALSAEESQKIQDLIDNPVFCADVGKPNELGNDCFCVEGDLSNMEEVDCLIASGVVRPDERENYRLMFESQN